MEHRSLGNTKTNISAIGLGCMGMSEFYGASDEQENIATLHHAIDLGINFFDTADMYGEGRNEELVGRALKQYRDKIILATKFGIVRDPNTPMSRSICGSPEYVKAACDASLKRLGIETIDLYYLHRMDKTVPIEDTMGAMADLVKAGKVRWLGLSEVSVSTLKKAHAVHPITALQTEYSLWSRDAELEILTACEALKVTFVAYSPLGRGFLTNTITSVDQLDKTDFRRMQPRLAEGNIESNLRLVEELKKLADAKGCTSAQLSLAWVLAKSDNIVPIPGTRRKKYLEENVAATNIKLSKSEVSVLDKLFNPEVIVGQRYGVEGMKVIDV